MRAFVFDQYKQPFHEADVPEPTVGDRDVLIRVEAAGLNHLDERLRAGEFKAILTYKTPLTLGHDVAGTVIRSGSTVAGFTAGDRVYARPRDFRIGTFAERIAVDETDVSLAPTSISTVEAASLPLVGLTAWQAVLRLAITALSRKTRARAKKLGVSYESLLMHASGEQLRRVAELVDTGVIRPIVGATFPFDQTAQALASLSSSSIRGKAVITGPGYTA